MPLNHTVREIELKNGIKGVLIDVPGSSVIAYDFHFRAGYHYSPSPERQQTAHIMEHLAFKGIKSFPDPDSLSRAFSKNGAYRNAWTNEYDMKYVIDAPKLDWKRLLELQKKVIAEPDYKLKTFKAEKKNVVEELTSQAGNHRRLLDMMLDRSMGETSFLDSEKIKTVEAVTLKDVQDHHDRTHTADNLRFSFTGDLAEHAEAIISQLEKWKLPRGERLSIPKKTYHASEPVAIFRSDLPSVTFIFRVILNRVLSEREQAATLILNHILTGTFHSRIFGEARRKGLSYSFTTNCYVSPDGISGWEIAGQVMPENAPGLFRLIRRNLQKVLEGDMTKAELDEAKEFLLGRYNMRWQTARDVNYWYAGRYFKDESIVDLTEQPSMIQRITLTEIVKLLKEFIYSQQWALGTIGNMKLEETKKIADLVAPLFKEEDNE